jgi:tagatose 6-phosphate kinase
VISRGADGLAAALDGRRYEVTGPSVAGNPTGAGDALSAVLAAAIAHRRPWPEALREGAAVAGAAASLPHAGEFDPAVAERLRPLIRVVEG